MITDYDVAKTPAKAVKMMHEAIDMFEKEMTKLQNAADEVTGKVREIKSCEAMRGISSVACFERTSTYGYCERNTEDTCIEAMKAADARLATSKAIHEANIPLIEENIKLREKIKIFMKNIGMPESYTEWYYKSSRSRQKDYKTIIAGWVQDMGKVIKIDDDWVSEQNRYEDYKKMVEEYRSKKTAEAKAKKDAEEAELKKQEGLKKLGIILAKYSLPASCTWEHVLNVILSKDKYLSLAHFLSLNRGDWNDGSNYAEQGISDFVIENEKDQEIANEINGLISNWDNDGRVFRDCKWNYDILFAMVNPVLLEDYNTVNSEITY